MKATLKIIRFIVGVLFIFSGLIKANDPLGLSYKMQEFFEVWGWHGLNGYTLSLSVLMIAFEIIAGVAVLVGWRMKLFSWLLLLLIIFFTFLTGYAVLSGKIHTCGCFGDCIPLTAETSFIKDLTLLVLIVFLFANRNRLSGSLSSSFSVLLLSLATVFSFGAQWYVLKHLPVLDCLPYKKGNNITEKMKVPAGAVPDSMAITMVYEKNGKQIEFSGNNFPADFDDSYKFIKRYDKLVRKGNAEAAIKDFSLQTIAGIDTTQAMLNDPNYQAWIFTWGINTDSREWELQFAGLYSRLKQKNIHLSFITSGSYDALYSWLQRFGVYTDVSVLKCDFVAIKTAARANPTLYFIKQGTIINKCSWADLHKAAETLDKLP